MGLKMNFNPSHFCRIKNDLISLGSIFAKLEMFLFLRIAIAIINCTYDVFFATSLKFLLEFVYIIENLVQSFPVILR